MNQVSGYLVVLTPVATHLVNPLGIAELRLSESAGAPLGAGAAAVPAEN